MNALPQAADAWQIGPLQLRVLHAMWRLKAETVYDVANALNAEPGAPKLAYTTFLTVMRNLARRGILRQEKRGAGRAHRFFTRVDEDGFKTAFIRRIVAEYCDGDLEKLARYASATEQPAAQ
jgi:predicted transcriptional regulator